MYSLILHGKRSVQLQKWHSLSVSVRLLQNAFAFSNSFSSATADVSPRQDGRKGNNFTVSYLVDSLGLTRKLAVSISRKVSSEGKGDPDSVLKLLTSNGFTDSQISSIVTIYPRLFILDAERSIGPKLQFLQSRGASTSELTEILSQVPKILGKKRIAVSVYYDFVKEIIEADKSFKYIKLCHSLPQGCRQENIIRNILALRELGVPQKLLFSMLISSHICGKERFEESVKKVVDMGFDPTTSKFVNALRAVHQMSDKTLEEKVDVYKRLGFDVEDIWAMFKKCPNILTYSEQKIVDSTETFLGLGFSRCEFAMMVKLFPQLIGLSAEMVEKKTEFIVKKMNWPLKAVALFPRVFSYSMEKRIVPRCNVIKALLSKRLLGSELPSMSAVLTITVEAFLNKFVRKYDDKEFVAELMAIFTGARVSLTDHLEQ